MSIKLNDKFVKGFIDESAYKSIEAEAVNAYKTVADRSGAGNDFLGWVDLPVNYDKDEFERIKVAAEKIKKNSDILIVIGRGAPGGKVHTLSKIFLAVNLNACKVAVMF